MQKETQQSSSSLRVMFTQGATQVTVLQALEAFLRIDMLGKSAQTALWYRNRLLPLVRYLGEDRILADLMETDLLEWYESVDRRQVRYEGGPSRPEIDGGLSADTKHGYVRAVKRFFKWLNKKGVLPADLAADLQLPKLPRRGKRGVPDDVARSMIAAAKENVRDYALLKFIESTGIRRGGAAHLLLSDLNLGAPTDRLRRRATVREKGDKERTVVMTPGTLKALEAWLAERPDIPGEEHVFIGQRTGRPWRPLTEAGISSVLRRYKQRLGIQGKTSAHEFRHRWFRKRLQEGMGLKQASQLGGHEDIGVTAKFYGVFAIDELQDAYDKHVQDLDEAE